MKDISWKHLESMNLYEVEYHTSLNKKYNAYIVAKYFQTAMEIFIDLDGLIEQQDEYIVSIRMKEVANMKLLESRYIDDQFKSLVSTNICGDEVVLSLWIKPVFIVRIKNPDIAMAYKHYFEILWRDAIKLPE